MWPHGYAAGGTGLWYGLPPSETCRKQRERRKRERERYHTGTRGGSGDITATSERTWAQERRNSGKSEKEEGTGAQRGTRRGGPAGGRGAGTDWARRWRLQLLVSKLKRR